MAYVNSNFYWNGIKHYDKQDSPIKYSTFLDYLYSLIHREVPAEKSNTIGYKDYSYIDEYNYVYSLLKKYGDYLQREMWNITVSYLENIYSGKSLEYEYNYKFSNPISGGFHYDLDKNTSGSDECRFLNTEVKTDPLCGENRILFSISAYNIDEVKVQITKVVNNETVGEFSLSITEDMDSVFLIDKIDVNKLQYVFGLYHSTHYLSLLSLVLNLVPCDLKLCKLIKDKFFESYLVSGHPEIKKCELTLDEEWLFDDVLDREVEKLDKKTEK